VAEGKCTAEDSINLSVLPQPAAKSIGDTAICTGTTIQLATTVVNGSAYSWSPATGLSSTTVVSPSASPTSTTQYILTVNPGALCTATDTVAITVNPLPGLAVSNDTIICAGGTGQIIATSAGNVTYSWSPSAGLSSTTVPNPLASPAATTKYFITVTDNNQCVSVDSVLVNVNPQPVFGVTPTTANICIGGHVTAAASGGNAYQWYPTAGVADPSAASTTLSPAATTAYQVIITNSTCKITDTVETVVTVTTKPDITVSKSNDIDCIVGQATLTATGGNQYTWSPATGLDNPYSPTPLASPLQTTTYYVTVSKGGGCTATDSIQLKVLTDVQNGYYLASVFTPNGDGHNDCFGVKLWGGIKTIDFSVYNRWGVRVFHTNNPSDCWDGAYNGQPQPPGTFVYQIQANTICGPVYRKGTVVLVR
jgi:gliding motility-associated-like protein